MAWLLRMPEVAANATEAVLQDWSVDEQATFSSDDPVATVETEKAVVDIEAEAAGVMLKRLVAPGTQVAVGAPIAVLGGPGEVVDDLDALLAELGVAAAPRGATTGDGPNGDHRERVFSSPLARRLAREAGLAIREIRGSGPHGRILRRDVEAAAAGRTSAEADARAAPSTPAVASLQGATYEEIPHSRIRTATAARLVESKQTAPHFYVRATIDAHRLVKLRDSLNDDAGVRVSLNDLVVKAVARAHILVPEMNVTWTPDAVRRYSTVDVGVAVATDRGLLTPVLRDVDSMPLVATAEAIKALTASARDGKLRQEDLEGGSITLTNLGMYGTEEFAAIINPPQAAILAVGAVHDEPVARKGRLKVRPVLRVTLSVDHRPVDGVVAARWMRELVSLVEHPLRILV